MHNSGLVLDSHDINGLAHSNNFDNKQNADFRGRQIGRAVVTGRVANDAKGLGFWQNRSSKTRYLGIERRGTEYRDGLQSMAVLMFQLRRLMFQFLVIFIPCS